MMNLNIFFKRYSGIAIIFNHVLINLAHTILLDWQAIKKAKILNKKETRYSRLENIENTNQ